MKKLNILKAIIDFIWIIAVPLTAPATFLLILFFLFGGNQNIDFNFVGIAIDLNDFSARVFIALLGINLLLLIYSLHIFRRVLRYFQKLKIFDEFVINGFKKIGLLLIIAGTSSVVLGVLGQIYFENRISIAVGYHPYLLVIGLGLFFQILSEIFKIAKETKQENDLTI